MEVKALAKFVHICPRKVRLVADLVRGHEFPEAEDILKYTPKKGARILLKVLQSAKANAESLGLETDPESLFVKKVFIDEGPMMYRFRAKSRGRAHRIRRRTSHITLVLGTE